MYNRSWQWFIHRSVLSRLSSKNLCHDYCLKWQWFNSWHHTVWTIQFWHRLSNCSHQMQIHVTISLILWTFCLLSGKYPCILIIMSMLWLKDHIYLMTTWWLMYNNDFFPFMLKWFFGWILYDVLKFVYNFFSGWQYSSVVLKWL